MTMNRRKNPLNSQVRSEPRDSLSELFLDDGDCAI